MIFQSMYSARLLLVLASTLALSACREESRKASPPVQAGAPLATPSSEAPVGPQTTSTTATPSPSPSPSPSVVVVQGCMIPVGWNFEGYAAAPTQSFTMSVFVTGSGVPVAAYNLTRTGGWPTGDGSWDGRIDQFQAAVGVDGRCVITGVWSDLDGSGGVELIFDDVAGTLDGVFWEGSIKQSTSVWKANRV
ncbi:MAG: hypothetical protein JNL01_02790 [Bdellovibrionales bacterium]|nr:hypothetical protein [Bdellovibrionales bacterium]